MKKIIVKILRFFGLNVVLMIGKVYLKHWDKDGVLIENRFVGENIITSAGKAQMALLAGDASAVPFTYLELGTSSTTPVVGDTALGAAITDTGLARVAATVSRITTSVSNDTLSLVGNWTASGAKTIAEIGIFNASSGGTMLARKLTGATTTENGSIIQFTYTVQFA